MVRCGLPSRVSALFLLGEVNLYQDGLLIDQRDRCFALPQSTEGQGMALMEECYRAIKGFTDGHCGAPESIALA